MKNTKPLPAVLSFQRGIAPTDATMHSVRKDGSLEPVRVVRHGIRGTQNVNAEGERDAAFVQVTESAKTSHDATGVLVKFSLKVFPVEDSLFSCASGIGDTGKEFREAFSAFLDKASKSKAYKTISQRVARNILNGRWLWRNRALGESVTIRVEGKDLEKPVEQDALRTSLTDFSGSTEGERKLAEAIAKGLRSGRVSLSVEASINFGFEGAVEVHPSQNYLGSKPKGFARSLYKLAGDRRRDGGGGDILDGGTVTGLAAIRDQKIGNALRTYDTWYPSFHEFQVPIPVEPNGACLDQMRVFRPDPKRSDSKSAFALLRNLVKTDPDSDDGLFLLACILRGGVYGESESDRKKDLADDAKEESESKSRKGKRDRKARGGDGPKSNRDGRKAGTRRKGRRAV